MLAQPNAHPKQEEREDFAKYYANQERICTYSRKTQEIKTPNGDIKVYRQRETVLQGGWYINVGGENIYAYTLKMLKALVDEAILGGFDWYVSMGKSEEFELFGAIEQEAKEGNENVTEYTEKGLKNENEGGTVVSIRWGFRVTSHSSAYSNEIVGFVANKYLYKSGRVKFEFAAIYGNSAKGLKVFASVEEMRKASFSDFGFTSVDEEREYGDFFEVFPKPSQCWSKEKALKEQEKRNIEINFEKVYFEEAVEIDKSNPHSIIFSQQYENGSGQVTYNGSTDRERIVIQKATSGGRTTFAAFLEIEESPSYWVSVKRFDSPNNEDFVKPSEAQKEYEQMILAKIEGIAKGADEDFVVMKEDEGEVARFRNKTMANHYIKRNGGIGEGLYIVEPESSEEEDSGELPSPRLLAAKIFLQKVECSYFNEGSLKRGEIVGIQKKPSGRVYIIVRDQVGHEDAVVFEKPTVQRIDFKAA